MIPFLSGWKGDPSAGGPPAIHVGARQTHKGGERGRDCQDAWWVGAHPPRVAVADGATLSFFAREWAWLVAEHFCRAGDGDGGDLAHALLAAPDAPWRRALEGVREEWRRVVWERIQGSGNLRGLLENRFYRRDAAVATLVGLEMDPERGQWRAAVIGDSCLLRFSRSGEFRDSLPLAHPEEFSNHPEALISTAGSPRETVPRVVTHPLREDEVLVLATDALAKWLLSLPRDERFAAVADLLRADEAGFGDRVAAARRGELPGAPAMEDDDVTLVVVAAGEALEGTVPLHGLAASLPPPLSIQALGPADPDGRAGTDGSAPDGHEAPPFGGGRAPGEPSAAPQPPSTEDVEPAAAPPASIAGAGAAAGLPQESLFDPPAPGPGPGEPRGTINPSPGDAPSGAGEPVPNPPERPAAAGENGPPPHPNDGVAPPRDADPAEGPLPGAEGPAEEEASPAASNGGMGAVPTERDETLPVGVGDPGIVRPSEEPGLGGASTPGRAALAVVQSPAPRPADTRPKPGGPIDRLARLGERRLARLLLGSWAVVLALAIVGVGTTWLGSDGEPARPDTLTVRNPPASREPPARGERAVPATLEIGTLVFPDTRNDAQPRLVVQSPVAARVAPVRASGWSSVELEAWVASRDGRTELASRRGGFVSVPRPMNARARPGGGEAVIGRLAGRDSFPFLGGAPDGAGWFRIRISGFVQDQQ